MDHQPDAPDHRPKRGIEKDHGVALGFDERNREGRARGRPWFPSASESRRRQRLRSWVFSPSAARPGAISLRWGLNPHRSQVMRARESDLKQGEVCLGRGAQGGS